MKIVLAIVIAAVACAASQAPVSSSNVVGPFSLITSKTSIDGVSIAKHVADAKVTAVVVFASWCHPCRHELGIMQALQREMPGLRVVAVNYYEAWGQLSDERRLRAYLKDHAPELVIVAGDPELIRSLGGVPKIPTLFLFNPDGDVAATFRRDKRTPPEIDELRAAITRIIAVAAAGTTRR